jgi:hypothetical protein
MIQAQMMDLREARSLLVGGCRPLRVNKGTGEVQIKTKRGVWVNSLLMRDEWVEVDNAVMQAARYPLRAVADLRSRGLTRRLGGIGSVVSRWYTSSEITGASINMTGRGGGNRDLPELIENNVPVPVIFKDFEIDARALEASRRMGDGLDVTVVTEATRVVAEAVENLLVNGASVRLNGHALYGYRTHPNRNTDTAANFGGGDWGTIANVVPTVAGMVNAANADLHYGPFILYASQQQYNEASLTYYTDGSGETPMQRILKMPMISAFNMLPADVLAAGEVLLVEMSTEVVRWSEAVDIQVREWASPDGMADLMKVLAIATPEVKARQDGKSGIVHATGA